MNLIWQKLLSPESGLSMRQIIVISWSYSFVRFDTIGLPECDGRTDRQTDISGIPTLAALPLWKKIWLKTSYKQRDCNVCYCALLKVIPPEILREILSVHICLSTHKPRYTEFSKKADVRFIFYKFCDNFGKCTPILATFFTVTQNNWKYPSRNPSSNPNPWL